MQNEFKMHLTQKSNDVLSNSQSHLPLQIYFTVSKKAEKGVLCG